MYTNWAAGEPNEAPPPETNEDRAQMHAFSAGLWQDVPGGDASQPGIIEATRVTINWVLVGDAGNASDTSCGERSHGGVAYEYLIGKYEVSNAQYTMFLNAVDPAGANPFGIYASSSDITFSSAAPAGSQYAITVDSADKSVNYVTFWDSCRFANWMHNGQGSGDTETGAYTLAGYTGPDGSAIMRNPGASIFLPSEDEWYKAAYYKGGGLSAGYWSNATQSDILPCAEPPPGMDPTNGSANYTNVVGDRTDVGAYNFKPSDSAYGTFDQAGNVWEWSDTLVAAPWRGLRQGDFGSSAAHVHKCFGNRLDNPDQETIGVGFRIAAIDCNGNGIADPSDIAGGTNSDCNANGVPDECEAPAALDCDSNGVPDACDIAGGSSSDCNANGTPDICEADCNNHGIADEFEVAAGTSLDCNTNDTLDECEADCDGDGTLDACGLEDDGDGVCDNIDVCPCNEIDLSVDCVGRPRLDLNGDCFVDGEGPTKARRRPGSGETRAGRPYHPGFGTHSW